MLNVCFNESWEPFTLLLSPRPLILFYIYRFVKQYSGKWIFWRQSNDVTRMAGIKQQLLNQNFGTSDLLFVQGPLTFPSYCFNTSPQSHLSRAIATRCKMDEVQTKTSTLIQKSHNATPKCQACLIVAQAPSGVTTNPTSRSAHASENMR